MLEFDVEVEGDVAAVDFMAVLVGAGEVFLYLNGKTSVFLSVLQLVEAVVLLSESLK